MWLGLALASALTWGVADFFGGLASRRARSVQILALAFPVGLVLVAAISLVLGEGTTSEELAWGAASGLVGSVGMSLLYAGLAIGPMNVVAPVSAVTSACVPVAAGLLLGERPGALVLVGIALTIVAGVLIGREPSSAGEGAEGPADPGAASDQDMANGSTDGRSRSLVIAVGAGLGLGAALVLLHEADPATGSLWAVAANRVAASLVMVTVALVTTRAVLPPSEARVRGLAVGAGIADAMANCLYFVALRTGLLSVVGVITALYPAGTVLLARLVLKERLERVQLVGLGVAGLAIVLITLG